jgi:hypothetical protein
MRRRTLLELLAAAGVAPAVGGCLWTESQASTAAAPSVGINFSGMEWTAPGIRKGNSTLANLHFTVPRKAEMAWFIAQGLKKNRLPVSWEMLQPVLFDAKPNAATRALVGEPGEFHAAYAQFITDVLDAHAAAGATCVLDLHNYCRYRDFRYAADGSVPGLTKGQSPLHRPFTEDPNGVQERIFSLAPGATLTQAHFTDFWVRAARRWKDHPGLAGYGLMNEPHDLPAPGKVEPTEGGGEDLNIWPTYARAAVAAIRKIDAKTPIYVASNEWSAAMALADRNPGFPLAGDNLVYEVHLYLDASSSGHAFDFDTEVKKGYSAGVGRGPIQMDTGVKRLEKAVRWAQKHNQRLALGEVGMPPDDPRWQEMFVRTVRYAVQNGVEVYAWMAGSHWPIRGHALGATPGWLQDRTLPPAPLGVLQGATGIHKPVLFDEVSPPAADGSVVVRVSARGSLAAPLTVNVAADGGRLSKTSLTLPAGVNPVETFTFTPPGDRVATLTYGGQGAAVPPARKVYGIGDPVVHAERNVADAALAILARYGASKWDMAQGFSDYVNGAPCQDGQPIRAVADSGFGSGAGHSLEMLNALNKDSAAHGSMALPVLRIVRGRKAAEFGANTIGLWCRKAHAVENIHPNPRDRVPYDLQDSHFAIALVSVPDPSTSGIVFQASKSEDAHASEIVLERGRPVARWTDSRGQQAQLAANRALAPNKPSVLTLVSTQGEQALRMDGEIAGRGAATFAPSAFSQLLIGWGFVRYYPREGLRGHIYGVITGKGKPSDAELAVLERYLLSLAA